MTNIIGLNVRVYRLLAGYSQDELCGHMQVAGHFTWQRATVSAVERGTRKVTLDEGHALAGIFGLPMEALVEEGEYHRRLRRRLLERTG